MRTFKHQLVGILIGVITFIFASCGSSEEQNQEEIQTNQERVEQEESEKKRTDEAEQRWAAEQAVLEKQIAYRVAINEVINTDNNLAGISIGDNTKQAEEMRKIDLSLCPSDFATAYIDHLHAWEEAGKVQRAQKDLKSYADLAVVAGILATFSESEATPFSNYLEAENELNKLATRASDEISRTWKIVEHIAVSYGGTLPR